MAIEVRHVSRTFGSWNALRDVSLTVNHGELVTLLGPSGSGKTTLLRIIAGLEQPDPCPETAVFINGVDISRQRPDERKVGFVFQHYALFRHMSVFENIAFGLRVRPRNLRPPEREIRRRVQELLELIQLGRWANQYPSQLSGGQRQRVALARALAIEPNVLLLDEPFGALDARVRQELRRWLRTLHARIHVTSVLVTHDQEEALEVADRIAIMNQGRIEQFGTPDEVFHHPASEFVVTFLGNVNLFHGRVESGKAMIGRLAVDASRALPVDGGTARVFVRPHELDIDVHRTNGASVRARVLRIQSAGPLVRVELASEEDDTVRTEDPINVELTHERYRELMIRVGDTVFVRLRDARVFVEDYSI
ncbi:MAG: TOBE-like domain-containing protein [Bryobacteraceae bacterium]|jgi:sulfate transport system ATP-binding protein